MPWYSRPLQAEDIESQRGLPAPRFRPGEAVRSVIGTAGDSDVRTEIIGPVAWYAWDWKRQTWIYRLALLGHRRRRWYLESELVPATEEHFPRGEKS
jgi:hypothetical protein